MALPLIDADGNPVLCAAIDIAGNPDDFSPPVVTKDATGALVWAQGETAGKLLNWRELVEEDYMSKVHGGVAPWHFNINEPNSEGGEYKEIEIDGKQYNMLNVTPLWADPMSLYGDLTEIDWQALIDYINGHSGETLPHITLELFDGNDSIQPHRGKMLYANDIGAKSLLFKPELYGDDRWNAYIREYKDAAYRGGFKVTFNVQSVEFDAMSYDDTTKMFSLTNPVLGEPVEVTYSLQYNGALVYDVRVNYATIVGSTAQAQFPEVIQDGIPFTLQGGKNWTLCASDIVFDVNDGGVFDGTGDSIYTDRIAITFKPRFYA